MKLSPENHLALADEIREKYFEEGLAGRTEYADELIKKATFHATMAVAGFLSQMQICGHGTRGYCLPCVLVGEFL